MGINSDFKIEKNIFLKIDLTICHLDFARD